MDTEEKHLIENFGSILLELKEELKQINSQIEETNGLLREIRK